MVKKRCTYFLIMAQLFLVFILILLMIKVSATEFMGGDMNLILRLKKPLLLLENMRMNFGRNMNQQPGNSPLQT